MKKLTCILIFVFVGLSSFGQSAESLWIEANGKLVSGDYTGAVESFSRMTDAGLKNTGQLMLQKGIAEYKAGDMAAAKMSFDEARKFNIAEAGLWLARSYTTRKQYANAIDNLKFFFLKDPWSEIAEVTNDSLLATLIHEPAWLDLMNALNDDPARNLVKDAEYYLSRGQTEAFKNELERVNQEKLDPVIKHSLKAQAYSKEASFQMAVNEINIALAREPENPLLLRQKISLLNEMDQKEQAYSALDKLLLIAPADFTARQQRVQFALETGKLQSLEEDVAILNKYQPNAKNRFLAASADYALGRYSDALLKFNRLIEEETPKAEYFKGRGQTYYKTRIYDQAAFDLSMSLDLTPDDAETNYLMGLAEQKLGNSKMACYYFTRAQKYGSKEVQDLLGNCK